MSIGPDHVPIIGGGPRIIIKDHAIVAPNSLELVYNGLDMGNSIAHLRVMDPLNARCIMVPLTEAQLDTLGSQVNQILTQANPTEYGRE